MSKAELQRMCAGLVQQQKEQDVVLSSAKGIVAWVEELIEPYVAYVLGAAQPYVAYAMGAAQALFADVIDFLLAWFGLRQLGQQLASSLSAVVLAAAYWCAFASFLFPHAIRFVVLTLCMNWLSPPLLHFFNWARPLLHAQWQRLLGWWQERDHFETMP